MDYGNYLGGKAKEELDSFDRLAGTYWFDADELEILREGKQVSEEEWEAMRPRLPNQLISLLYGKEIIKISERTNSKRKEWDLQDVDGSLTRFHLSKIVKEKKDKTGSYREEQLIEDDVLVTQHHLFDRKGQLVLDMKDSIAIDDEGIIRSRSG